MEYALFGSAANRYDWHTPPHHYQHDHAFVIARLPAAPGRVLDVGCGTGVFLEKAIAAGFDATGLDASPEMVSLAARRVGKDRVRLGRMQELAETASYDGIVSLSWSFNYMSSFREARNVLSRFFEALKPGGRLILQLAHAANATGALNEDREPGPEGQPDDVLFLYRFSQVLGQHCELRAQYVYGCKSQQELVAEEHRLSAADAYEVAAEASAVGFKNVELLNSWRGEPLDQSVSAFLLAARP
ncbi:MAG: class I SAM-dependent methyltransferase [Acidobacteria bacterium]|nr:MAG: class I SAM-dependent methyltransferase [Acidobacteriota bacterium]